LHERFESRLKKNVYRIDCFANAAGPDYRSQFACSYLSSTKELLGVSTIDIEHSVHAPIFSWSISSNDGLGEIGFERDSSRTVQFFPGTGRLNIMEIRWLEALVDAISAGPNL
jgi:hypothetical protein